MCLFSSYLCCGPTQKRCFMLQINYFWVKRWYWLQWSSSDSKVIFPIPLTASVNPSQHERQSSVKTQITALCGMSDSCLKEVHFGNQYPKQSQEIVAIHHFMKLQPTDSEWISTTCCVELKTADLMQWFPHWHNTNRKVRNIHSDIVVFYRNPLWTSQKLNVHVIVHQSHVLYLTFKSWYDDI